MAELTPQQEKELAAAFMAAYAAWLPQAEAAVLGGYTRFGIAPDPAAINTTSNLWRQQIQQIENQDLADIAAQSYEEEDPGHGPGLGAALVVAASAATMLFLTAQVGEIQAQLFGQIGNARNLAEAAAVIRNYLSPANPHWAAKAAQLAATEGDRWAQAATLAGALVVQQRDGQPRDKIWDSRDDDKVRPAHVAADGQRRPLNQPFNVAGFPMMYPLDPAAPVDLVANCRCKLRIVRREAPRG
jgi:hypothetical protein